MKTLADYMEPRQTAIFEECESFFAFSEEQFENSKKDNVKYRSLGYGLFCPENKADYLAEGMEAIYKKSILDDIEENGIKEIVKRELYNHEAFYTNSIEDTIDKLDDYPGITAEYIDDVFKELKKKK